MIRRVTSIIGAIFCMVIFTESAQARKVQATYEGDHYAESYRGVAQAIFNLYDTLDCKAENAHWTEKHLAKIRKKQTLDENVALLAGGCLVEETMCFQGEYGESCFSNGGRAWLADINFSRNDERAKVNWHFAFYDLTEGSERREGIVMQVFTLEKTNENWNIVEQRLKMLMDTTD